MVEIYGINFYTIDEIVSISGYQKNTIYNFVSEEIISPPVRGLVEADYKSQGLYKETVLHELRKYQMLKITGMKKCDIIEQLKIERATANESLLPLLEARR